MMMKFFRKKNKDNKGFTLVELIIVVAVIAVLAAVLAPQYLQYVERSRESNDLQIATNLMKAAQIAVADPKSGVPSGYLLEVLWATNDEYNSTANQGIVLVRFPDGGSGRASVIGPGTGTGKYPALTKGILTKENGLANIQESIIEIMGADAYDWSTDGDVAGKIGEGQSAASKKANFSFMICSGTGEIALAYLNDPKEGDVNVWIDEIGVDATRYTP